MRFASGAGTRPRSERLCDGICVAFATWTLCCHALVGLGGNLYQLIGIYASALILVAVGWLTVRGRSRAARPTPSLASQRTSIAGGAVASRPSDEPETALAREEAGETRRSIARVAAIGLGIMAALVLDPKTHPGILWWVMVGLLGAAAVRFLLTEPPRCEAPARSRRLEAILWVIGLVCLGVTWVAHRPNLDDAFYLNVSVAAADSPDRGLMSGDTIHGVPDLALHNPAHRIHTYELWNGALSLLTGIPVIYCTQWLSAGLFAFLVPLAHARLFRVLTPHYWIWPVAAVVVVLLASGEIPRSYGNFSFVRIWQGKGVYLFFFMPLVYSYGICFARRPTPLRWTMLTAAQIGAVGCSSTAVWAAPVGALMALSCSLRPSRRHFAIFAVGALASAYVLIVGLLLKGEMQSLLEAVIVREAFGARFEDALSTVLGESRLLKFTLAAVLVSWACCSAGLARRFAIIFPLAVWLILLNPYWDRWIAGNLTGESYWRALWALPAPILIALVLVSPLARHTRAAAKLGNQLACAGMIAAFALWIPAFSTLSEQNAGRSGLGISTWAPELKVPKIPYRWAKALTRSVPPGSIVVAPTDITAWIPTLHDRAYPLTARPLYLARPRANLDAEEAAQRLRMTRYVSGKDDGPQPHEFFRRGLERFGVKGVCLRISRYTQKSRTILRETNFRRKQNAKSYEIWVRD